MAGSISNDVAIMRLASARGGVCTRPALLDAGLTPRIIERRVSQGALRRLGRGVYLVEALSDRRTPLYRASALLPASTLSDFTAAEIDGFPVDPADVGALVHVTVAAAFNRRIDGIVLHRRRRPPGFGDVRMADGLRITTPARTIVDLSSTVGRARLTHIVQTQVRDDNPTLDELVACFDSIARRGVTGVAMLRRILAPMVDGSPIAGSVLEDAVAGLLVSYGLEGFRRQYRPPWYDGLHGVVDFANPDLGVVLEADGRRWHRRDQDMTIDRRRDRLAAAHGWLSIRVTWAEIRERPAATAAEIRDVLQARAAIVRIA